MIAKLIYRLPEEQHEYASAYHGADFQSIVRDIDTYLRNRLKYEELDEKTHKALQDARDELWIYIKEYNLEGHIY